MLLIYFSWFSGFCLFSSRTWFRRKRNIGGGGSMPKTEINPQESKKKIILSRATFSVCETRFFTNNSNFHWPYWYLKGQVWLLPRRWTAWADLTGRVNIACVRRPEGPLCLKASRKRVPVFRSANSLTTTGGSHTFNHHPSWSKHTRKCRNVHPRHLTLPFTTSRQVGLPPRSPH